jgi:signal peptidase I
VSGPAPRESDSPEAPPPPPPPNKRQRSRRWWLPLAAIAALLGVIWLASALFTRPYQIPSEAMEPTLAVGDRILVDRHGIAGDPEPGDVVVFHPPQSAITGRRCGAPMERDQACAKPGSAEATTTFVKRVVAGPGDELSVQDGIPIVNGEPFEGDWEIRPCSGLGGCDLPKPITIPPDHYFMMGDNRGASEDSRHWGPIPSDWIIGEVFIRYWPPSRIGGV